MHIIIHRKFPHVYRIRNLSPPQKFEETAEVSARGYFAGVCDRHFGGVLWRSSENNEDESTTQTTLEGIREYHRNPKNCSTASIVAGAIVVTNVKNSLSTAEIHENTDSHTRESLLTLFQFTVFCYYESEFWTLIMYIIVTHCDTTCTYDVLARTA